MCCPAGEHVSTDGEKNFLQAAFPPSQTPSPKHLHMERRRKGEWRRSKADGEEGNENANCREMEKVLNGKKKKKTERGEESGWPEKKERKNSKDAF